MKQISQNKYCNKRATVLPKLRNNTKVWFKEKMKETSKQGIIKVGPQHRTHVMKREEGGVYRSNYIRQEKSED